MKNSKKKRKRGNWNNTLISVFALVISAISLWLSYYSYRESQVERLNIKISSHIKDNYQTKISLLGENVVIPIYWDVLLVNNSEKTISITDINLESDKFNQTSINNYFGNDILFSIEDFDDNKLNLPLIINSGESKKVYVRVYISCGEKASLLLKNKYGLSKQHKKSKLINIDNIPTQFTEKGFDIFDNKITTMINDEINSSIKIEMVNRPKFKISCITGKGGVFESSEKLCIIGNE